MLSLAYVADPENVRAHGIYSNFETYVIPSDTYLSSLSEGLDGVKNMIITSNPDDLATKISAFLESGYDLTIIHGNGGGYM